MSLLIDHVKNHYKLLNHQGLWSQVHAQNKQENRLLDRCLLFGEEAIIRWVRQYNGRADLYIGRNPRTKEGKVASISCMSIDIDPVRDKDTASSYDQLQEAFRAGKNLLLHNLYTKGVIASSGNGCHIYWPFETHGPATAEFQNKIKLFEQNIRSIIEEKFNVKVDAIYDNPRLVKIIGTQATKGELNQRRNARFLQTINWSRLFDGNVYKRIQDSTEEQQISRPSTISKTKNVDRSNLDYGLALRLKREGSSSEDIRAFLQVHGYRTPERPDDIERILFKLFKEGYTKTRGHSVSEIPEHKSVEVFTPATHFQEFERIITADQAGGDTKLLTGIPTLDGYTGGLKKGGIWIVGADTGDGKTSCSITILDRLLEQGLKVLIFTTEMDWLDIFSRFASMGTGISLHTLTNDRAKLSSNDKKKLKEYATTFKSKSLLVIQTPEPEIGEVVQEISRIRPDVCVIDHIQRIAESRDSRHREISRFIKAFNTACRINDCAGLVNSQVKRPFNRDLLTMHDLKECGDLENEAHAVLLLNKAKNGITMADLAKNRGPKGHIELKFDKITCRFEEI